MIPAWESLDPQERARVRERVYRHLQRLNGTSAVGVMHGCALTMDYVSGALVALEVDGAAQRAVNTAGIEIWTIVVSPNRAPDR